MPGGMVVRIINNPSELAKVHAALEDFLGRHGISGRSAYHIQLALDELVTNVISYAYDDGQRHEIRLSLDMAAGAVRATLEDDGKPFNPLDKPAPDLHASLDERPVGGLGIYFARVTMDELTYERLDGKNILRLVKKIA